jgi:orotate phosphoribosyltransferase
MQQYKEQFIEFMVRSSVLMFGEFTTKSGRQTPFFINTGRYESGSQLEQLGNFYAAALNEQLAGQVDVLFGPAYKGIPLVVTTAIALNHNHGSDLSFCFNRKEAKDHGEGGSVIGHRVKDGERVAIIEDVTTAGTSIRESVALLDALAKVHYAGVIVSVDRMERGSGSKSALEEIRDSFGITIYPIVTLQEVVSHLHNRPIDGRIVLDDATKGRIDDYRATYGV